MVWRWLGMVSLAVVMAACGDSDGLDEPKPEPVVDYQNWLDATFQFDAEGSCPIAAGMDLSDEMKRLIAGHGWIHDATFEIDEKGRCDQRSYYEYMDGVSPEHFYFSPEGKLIQFQHINAIPASGFFTFDYRFDISDNSIWAGPDEGGMERRVLQILEVKEVIGEGRGVFLVGLVSLGVKSTGTPVYGLFLYHRAQPDELEELYEKYPTDLSELEWR